MNGIRKIQLVFALAVAAMVPSGAREQIYRASTHEEWFRGLDGLSISREVCDGIPAMKMVVCRSKAGQGRFLLRAEERDSPELYLLPEEAEKAVVRIRVYLPEGGAFPASLSPGATRRVKFLHTGRRFPGTGPGG